jgi:spore coat protein U-like protein
VIDASTTITITCTNTTAYNVGLSPGNGTGATVTNRLMTNGAVTVQYGLFSDAARSVNWGQTVPTDTVAKVGTGAAQVLTVYGRVTAGRFVAPGTYNDIITATVTY